MFTTRCRAHERYYLSFWVQICKTELFLTFLINNKLFSDSFVSKNIDVFVRNLLLFTKYATIITLLSFTKTFLFTKNFSEMAQKYFRAKNSRPSSVSEVDLRRKKKKRKRKRTELIEICINHDVTN